MHLMCFHHPAAQMVTIDRGTLGAVSVKPTSFLTSNVDSLAAHAKQLSVPKQWNQPLIGKGVDGKFKPFLSTEYPPLVNMTLACATIDNIQRITSSLPGVPGALTEWEPPIPHQEPSVDRYQVPSLDGCLGLPTRSPQ